MTTFSELPVGAKFRFHRRGAVHTKKTKTTYDENYGTVRVVDDIDVIPEGDTPPPTRAPKTVEEYFGIGNRVQFTDDNMVTLNGTFDLSHLSMVANELKKRLK